MAMSRDELIGGIDDLLHEIFSQHMRPDRHPPPHPDLTVGQMHCVPVIDALGAPTMSELAAALGLKPNTISVHVDALVERGLVRRERDRDDRRVVRVMLTREGRRGRDRFRQLMRGRLRDLLSDVSHEDLRAIHRALTIMRDAAARRAAATRPADPSHGPH